MSGVLHYGLQRSGTNYLEAVLRSYCRTDIVNDVNDRKSPLHKHFRLYADKDLIPTEEYRNHLSCRNYAQFADHLGLTPRAVLVISKDPWSWLLSYSRWARKCNWPPVAHHYIEEYNQFYRTWLRFSRESADVSMIRYRDLLTDPREVIRDICRRHGISKRWFAGSISPQVPQSEEFSAEKRQSYLRKDYMAEFSPEALSDLNKRVDMDLVRSLGYR